MAIDELSIQFWGATSDENEEGELYIEWENESFGYGEFTKMI